MQWYPAGYCMEGRVQPDGHVGHPDRVIRIMPNPSPSGGFTLTVQLVTGGAIHTMFERTWSDEDLEDVYELAHHQLHGKDPRGLDPREGPTRIHPGPR